METDIWGSSAPHPPLYTMSIWSILESTLNRSISLSKFWTLIQSSERLHLSNFKLNSISNGGCQPKKRNPEANWKTKGHTKFSECPLVRIPESHYRLSSIIGILSNISELSPLKGNTSLIGPPSFLGNHKWRVFQNKCPIFSQFLVSKSQKQVDRPSKLKMGLKLTRNLVRGLGCEFFHRLASVGWPRTQRLLGYASLGAPLPRQNQ